MTWAHTLWFGYTWPSLKGNGPEAIIQTVAYAVIAVAVWPVARRFARREMAKVHERVDAHRDELLAELAETRRALHHLIKHSAMPDLPDPPETVS